MKKNFNFANNCLQLFTTFQRIFLLVINLDFGDTFM
jgi:hypothetical protein